MDPFVGADAVGLVFAGGVFPHKFFSVLEALFSTVLFFSGASLTPFCACSSKQQASEHPSIPFKILVCNGGGLVECVVSGGEIEPENAGPVADLLGIFNGFGIDNICRVCAIRSW